MASSFEDMRKLDQRTYLYNSLSLLRSSLSPDLEVLLWRLEDWVCEHTKWKATTPHHIIKMIKCYSLKGIIHVFHFFILLFHNSLRDSGTSKHLSFGKNFLTKYVDCKNCYGWLLRYGIYYTIDNYKLFLTQ